MKGREKLGPSSLEFHLYLLSTTSHHTFYSISRRIRKLVFNVELKGGLTNYFVPSLPTVAELVHIGLATREFP